MFFRVGGTGPQPEPRFVITSGVLHQPGTSRLSRTFVADPGQHPTNAAGADFAPYNYFVRDALRAGAGGNPSSIATTDYNGTGIQAAKFARWHVDQFLALGTPVPAIAIQIIDWWVDNMDPVLTLDNNQTSGNPSNPNFTNGLLPTAVHPMSGFLFAAADAGHVPADAIDWLNRCEALLDNTVNGNRTGTNFRIGHNFRSSTIGLCAAAHAAVVSGGATNNVINKIPGYIEDHIFDTFNAAGTTNVEEDGRSEPIHYDNLEMNGLIHAYAYIRANGLDISSTARTRWETRISQMWPHYIARAQNPVGTTVNYTIGGVNKSDDGSPLAIPGITCTLEWMVTLGLAGSNTVPVGLQGDENSYFHYTTSFV